MMYKIYDWVLWYAVMIGTGLKRTWLELSFLVGIALFLFFSPSTWFFADAKMGLLNLGLSKLLFVSAGALHAHVSRKLFFPYLDLGKLIKGKKERMSGVIFLTMWYGLIIFAWARGG